MTVEKAETRTMTIKPAPVRPLRHEQKHRISLGKMQFLPGSCEDYFLMIVMQGQREAIRLQAFILIHHMMKL